MSQGETKSYEAVEASLPLSKVNLDEPRQLGSGSRANLKTLVVLDDDPTGTQTVHDITVLTSFDKLVLEEELAKRGRGFFILTNSRAYPEVEAKVLLGKLLRDLHDGIAKVGVEVEVVTRSDSCLRGHFPLEPELVHDIVGPFDAWVLTPAFFEGGRVTVDDVHYVREGDDLVPVAMTPFAADKAFGFRSSNLRAWVAEKFQQAGQTPPEIVSISIEDLRRDDAVAHVASRLEDIKRRSKESPRTPPVIILNVFHHSDMKTFITAKAQTNVSLLYRSGASLVSAYLGIDPVPPITPQSLSPRTSNRPFGGLIIVGSYVPKTTIQLSYLLENCRQHLEHIQIDVQQVLKSSEIERTKLVAKTVSTMEEALQQGLDVVVSTSRQLITHEDAQKSLRMGKVISDLLCSITASVNVRPKYVIAKGGITSSDIATQALQMKKANVVGQAAPGIPLWESSEQDIAKWADVPYIVFPGNVGGEHALGNLVASYR
ncbi:hypothetical protein A1O1_06671 [Capronia coronata CBS 617.96]|uniref:Hydroxyacid dehydrogenase n=1 Tax=Capronia coronata CBS 617.96 TaxID=1182541 RepID=W9XS51_9EURO|nr:uncharacterized protein A1O1_06671 [Capronia coronata CBS 617.96]EXJ83053.1 hypothetical protein A1O1_06671 [Capronia coronata CBS 617.96]